MSMEELERTAAEAVSPERIRDDLERLVGIPSLTGQEDEIQGVLAGLLGSAGLEVSRPSPDPAAVEADPDWPGSEVARSSLPIVIGRMGESGGRRIILCGHVDVVPPGDPGTWSTLPFEADVRDGRLYGRGACDMKGGVVAILEAVRVLHGLGDRVTLRGELLVTFVPSEEDGGQGMLAAIRAGAVGDLAVITEPSSLDVVIAHAGAITFRLTVPGRAAHASKRLEGVSALDKLLVLVRALQADEARRNGHEHNPLMTALGLPYPTIVGTVHGGDWASTVLDKVVVEGRYGVRLGQTWREAEDDLRSCIVEACERDDFLRRHPAAVAITGGRFSSAEVPADHPLPAGLARAIEDVLGRSPPLVGAPYGADMRLLINEGRTPTVIFGPGDAAVAHSADEFVPLDEVAECARVLAVWALRHIT
jgi:acetylornithine deacetylase